MYLDLELKVRTDGAFRHKLMQLSRDLIGYYELSQRQEKYLKVYQDRLYEIVEFCQFNLSFLVGYYFPAYPKDKPLSLADYPFAFQLMALQVGGFLCVKGSRQISKSTTLSVRQILNARLFPGFKSLYVCPRSDQLVTYANKLREIERAYRFYKPDHNLRSNLKYKEFANKSTIELIYVLTSASNARGKSCDELAMDEFQDFDPDLEIEVGQIQSASLMPITIYAGTSLTTESALEKKWQQSSQGIWVMKCTGVGAHENIPLPEHGVMDMIQPQGPSCHKCGALLDVRGGQFVHQDQRMLNIGQRGVHIPQLIMPSVYLNEHRWSEIYKAKFKNIRKFMQEILGIATQEGEREITLDQLKAICVLGTNLKLLREKAATRKYVFTVGGCDWGGSDYIAAKHIKVSTTVHCILGANHDGTFDILHYARYLGMNYDDIVGCILRDHKAFNCLGLASDFGVGALYNAKLRESIPPERHLIFNYTGPTSALIDEPAKGHMYNQWSLNKTESISMTFEAVRELKLKCFSWEYAGEFLTDFLAVFRAPAEKDAGANTFLYRSSATAPNDALQATNYAYMLGKILLGEPMFVDKSLRIRLVNAMRSNMHFVGGGKGTPKAFSR